MKEVDPLLRSSERALVLLGPVQAARVFGYSYTKNTRTEEDRGIMFSDEYDGSVDWYRYGSTLQTVRAVLRSDLSGRSFSPVGEHNLYHSQTSGDVFPGGASNFVTETAQHSLSSDSHGQHLEGVGYIYTVPTTLRATRNGLSVSYSQSGSQTLNEGWPALFIRNDKLYGRYSRGADVSCTHASAFGGQRTMRCSNIQFWTYESSVHLEYRLTIHEASMYYDGRWRTGKQYYGAFSDTILDVTMDATVGFLYSDGSRSYPSSSEAVAIDTALIGSETWTYRCRQANSLTADGWYADSYPSKCWYLVPGNSWTWTNRTYCKMDSSLYTSTSFPGSDGVACTIFNKGRADVEGKFRHWFDLNLPDIRAASSLSSSDAMMDLQSSSGTDVLQTLVKVPEISSQIPKIREGIDIVRDLAHRKLNAREVLDFLTQSHLQQSFQWRPEFDLLTKYLPQIPRILLSFTTTQGTVVGRGRFDYDFTGDECYRTCHLSCRTKIVAVNSFSDLSATFLRAHGLGVLPTPENLWDIMPFSFVINWFTNMGKRIRTLGSLANMWLLDPVVIVHSYKLTSVLTDADLQLMQLRRAPAAGVEPNMSIYKREITRYVALLNSSRFDFGRPTGTPSWSVVASLLWQWMK